ncbi:hypothetical protein EVY06_12655 [Citrobacter koseri]|uniref:Uncharacterized protein n=1 Tax=Citrobacter koseri TaxID=545 RepID=A0AAQ1A5M8_CITKO|nr:hypothetical protein CEP66_20340 [Citrobacter koseri]ATF97382.1 hypothetical protein CO700_10135 [Citrobacter koseri]AVE59648.1 hypothetical protein AM352_15360 [Citrobacter koseri]AVE68598.1 hypothetical protein AM351_12620 [Citrobacter koseri]AYY75465.1 hypothetical protein EGX86_17175 [Citrobacter koseri]
MLSSFFQGCNFARKLTAISITFLRQINNESVPLLNSSFCRVYIPPKEYQKDNELAREGVKVL